MLDLAKNVNSINDHNLYVNEHLCSAQKSKICLRIKLVIIVRHR